MQRETDQPNMDIRIARYTKLLQMTRVMIWGIAGLGGSGYVVLFLTGAYQNSHTLSIAFSLLGILAMFVVLIGGIQKQLESIKQETITTTPRRGANPTIALLGGIWLVFLAGGLFLIVNAQDRLATVVLLASSVFEFLLLMTITIALVRGTRRRVL